MKKLILAATLCAGVAACGSNESTTANDSAAGEAVNGSASASTTTQTASAAFPRGARIVEENGVTYRIDADGTRVQLGPNQRSQRESVVFQIQTSNNCPFESKPRKPVTDVFPSGRC